MFIEIYYKRTYRRSFLWSRWEQEMWKATGELDEKYLMVIIQYYFGGLQCKGNWYAIWLESQLGGKSSSQGKNNVIEGVV